MTEPSTTLKLPQELLWLPRKGSIVAGELFNWSYSKGCPWKCWESIRIYPQTTQMGSSKGISFRSDPFHCILPPGDLCNAHSIQLHCHTDNNPLYLCFRPPYPAAKQNCIQNLETCISEIQNWMSTILLKLKDSKTEFIILGTRQQLKNAEASDITIKIGSEDILSVPTVQNLGYMFDSQLKNTAHINKLTATLFSTLKKIAHIRYPLDQDTTKILVQSLIMSKLDYCNGILAGSMDYNINKLQRIQNTSCRAIFHLGKYDSITPHLAKCHWLKIRDWITHKTAMLVFKCRTDAAPKYLIDLLDLTHNRTLRSSSRNKSPVKTANITQILNSSFRDSKSGTAFLTVLLIVKLLKHSRKT